MDKAQKKYRDMQREYYDKQSMSMLTQNHSGHENNPDYARTLLQNCHTDPKWENAKVFEFGCGCGRNILWLRKHAGWTEEVSGCDISSNNVINMLECITDVEEITFADPRRDKKKKMDVDLLTRLDGVKRTIYLTLNVLPRHILNFMHLPAWIVGQPHQIITTWFFNNCITTHLCAFDTVQYHD